MLTINPIARGSVPLPAMRTVFILIVSTVCSIIGGVIGDYLFGLAGSIILSTATGIYGLWLGYKLHRDYLEG